MNNYRWNDNSLKKQYSAEFIEEIFGLSASIRKLFEFVDINRYTCSVMNTKLDVICGFLVINL